MKTLLLVLSFVAVAFFVIRSLSRMFSKFAIKDGYAVCAYCGQAAELYLPCRSFVHEGKEINICRHHFLWKKLDKEKLSVNMMSVLPSPEDHKYFLNMLKPYCKGQGKRLKAV